MIKPTRIVTTFTLIAIVGMLLSTLPTFNLIRAKAGEIILPLPKLVKDFTNRQAVLLQLWANVTSLGKENEELVLQNLELKSQLERLRDVELQNLQLRNELNIGGQSTFAGKTVIGRVIGLSPSGFFQTVVVDVGLKDGVSVGKPVLSNGFLVGTLSEVGETSATVRSISAHNSKIPVVLSTSRAKGLLKGGVRGLVVEDIPVDTPISAEETVVTAGLIDAIPAGIAVGKVQEIISTKGEIFQVAKVSSPIKANQLEIVVVLK